MYSETIKSASCIYHEILDHKIIVNSDGVEVELYDSKPEFNIVSVARRGSESVTSSEGVGVTGGWEDLFSKKDPFEYATLASEKATKLLEAKHVIGEKTTIILDPGMVGLISHEAIGHMVEADFVLSGSIVKDRIGQKVASELITLVDSGQSNIAGNAAGTIAVDDEGVMAGRTVIIENGILKSFLHNRETALMFDTRPTGNARAFEYNDEPLIRMRNTFIEPRNDKLDDIIKETKHGYLIKGPRNGQADANGEFMFGSQEVYSIQKGEIQQLMKGSSISGNAFDVLESVDMVGNDFKYDIGTGYCGKFQPAKVDGGGPHLRWYCNYRRFTVDMMEDVCSFAVREAEKRGAEYAEAYMTKSKESEVFIENNDLKQLKYHKNSGLGIRVFVDGSLGFSSVNVLEREPIKDAAMQAIKLARVSPADKFNSMPKEARIKFLEGIYDINAESFSLYDATKLAADMLVAAKSF